VVISNKAQGTSKLEKIISNLLTVEQECLLTPHFQGKPPIFL